MTWPLDRDQKARMLNLLHAGIGMLSIPPSLVAHASIGNGADGGTTAAINTGGATLLVAIVASASTIGASGVVSDSKNNTWTARNLATATNASCRIFDCVAPVVGSDHTFTSTLVGGYPFLAVGAFKGTMAGGSFSKQGTSNASSQTSLPTGLITPDYNNALVVTGISCDNADSAPTCTIATVTDASAIVPVVNFAGGLAYIAQKSASGVNPVWSWTTANDCAAAIAVYRSQ